ncbi:hypothetical protein HAX54_024283 [Datura stramonium]|uniref:Uncharacterized protein n=1 Tax=Datura stramonium TaxID=4076 RepID=A0ABS8UXQ1_DATST|nr:hypothetical protein [Datura stramonium]
MVVLRLRGVNKVKSLISFVLRRRSEGSCGRGVSGLHAVREHACNLWFGTCLYLTVVFLLRASLVKSGTLSQKWNGKTVGYILLFCLPVFAVQLILILAGPQLKKNHMSRLPHYFTSPFVRSKNDVDVALCTYPLLSIFCLSLCHHANFIFILAWWKNPAFALKKISERDIESRRRLSDEQHETAL